MGERNLEIGDTAKKAYCIRFETEKYLSSKPTALTHPIGSLL